MRKVILAGAAALLFVLPCASFAKPPAPNSEKRDELYKKLDILAETLHLVQLHYVEDVKADDMVYGAIEGLLQKLDPHSGFMPPKVFEDEQEEMMGSFEGVGIELSIKDGRLIIVTPIEDGPAFQVGVQAGDEIMFIGDDPTTDMDFNAALKKLRGPKGSKVSLKLKRQAAPDLVTVMITRDVIKMKSVKSRRMGDVGVVRITRFQKDTHAEVADALKKMTKDGELKGLVLDLRNNPGGLLDQAVKVSDLFLKEGVVVSTRGRDPEQEAVYKAKDDGTEPAYPMAVLINLGTASAAEIVSGALQDQKRAIVIGERSFGKGSVQTLFPMTDGSGIRITSALYYTPANRSIQAQGIVPDMEVSSAVPKKNPGDAPRDTMHGLRREENIKGHFDNPKKNGDEKKDKEKDKPKDDAKDNAKDKVKPAAPPKGDDGADDQADQTDAEPKTALVDPQLDRALQLINNWELLRTLDKSLPKAAPAADAKPVEPVKAGGETK